MTSKQQGFTHFVALLAILFLAVAGYALLGISRANKLPGGGSSASGKVICRYWTSPSPVVFGKPVTAYMKVENGLNKSIKISRHDLEARTSDYGKSAKYTSKSNISIPARSTKTINMSMKPLPKFMPDGKTPVTTLVAETYWSGGTEHCKSSHFFK